MSFCCRYGECLGCYQEREATLRADLARVTAERDGLEEGLTVANNAAERRGRERDAARAQVRDLLNVARAVVAYQEAAFANDERAAAGCELDMFDALTTLPPSALVDPAE